MIIFCYTAYVRLFVWLPLFLEYYKAVFNEVLMFVVSMVTPVGAKIVTHEKYALTLNVACM